jgi:hypothetical protein
MKQARETDVELEGARAAGDHVRGPKASKGKRRRAAALTTVLTLVLAGVAYAYFTSQGSGAGTAAVGTDAGVEVADITFDGTLYPGASVGVAFKVQNNSSDAKAKVGSVIADTAAGTNGITGLPQGCSADDFTYTPGAAINAEIDPSGELSGAGTLTMANTAQNQDACKNASPVLNLVVDNQAI